MSKVISNRVSSPALNKKLFASDYRFPGLNKVVALPPNKSSENRG
jgi:hypothetical protein